jgi:hypothetical protein
MASATIEFMNTTESDFPTPRHITDTLYLDEGHGISRIGRHEEWSSRKRACGAGSGKKRSVEDSHLLDNSYHPFFLTHSDGRVNENETEYTVTLGWQRQRKCESRGREINNNDDVVKVPRVALLSSF